MSDLKQFSKLVDDIWEMVFGTTRRTVSEWKDEPDNHDFSYPVTDYAIDKVKRARTKDGRFRGDDKSTPDVNEAWVGGKKPMRHAIYKKRKGKK